MIEEIKIKNKATYKDEQAINQLSKFNYFYGGNGSGKTTISRVIAKNTSDENVVISWKDNKELDTFVYNSDFIEKNFNQSEQIKGIFTLGEENIETLKKISDLTDQKKEEEDNQSRLEKTLNGDAKNNELGKTGDLKSLENEFIEKCWKMKKKHSVFDSAFTGLNNNRKKFCEKVLLEEQSNSSEKLSLEELKKKSETLFGDNVESYDEISFLKDSEINLLESNEIINKKIIGNADVDIASMIKDLEISDWVREGKNHLNANDGKVCPFCQQEVKKDLTTQLNTFFDESYDSDIKLLKEVVSSYEDKASKMHSNIQQIIKDAPSLLDTYTDNLSKKNDRFKNQTEANILELKKNN